MTSVKVVMDSSCTMEKNVRGALGIRVMPLSIMTNGTVYPDDDQLDGERFMGVTAKAKNLPKTSQPPTGELISMYDELGEGGSEVISTRMTKGLGGTVEAVRQASNPTKMKATVIDSDTTDQGLSFQVTRAVELAKEGKTVEKILEEVKKVQDNTKLHIGISTLDNLVKGRRISRTIGLLFSVLNIRVVMNFAHSELIPVTKGRRKKMFDKWFSNLKDELKKLSNVRQIGISYADAKELAQEFKEGLQELFPDTYTPVLHTNPVIATRIGKDAFAIIYYVD